MINLVYLPMDCPNCGRRRLLYDGINVVCEKCYVLNWTYGVEVQDVLLPQDDMDDTVDYNPFGIVDEKETQ